MNLTPPPALHRPHGLHFALIRIARIAENETSALADLDTETRALATGLRGPRRAAFLAGRLAAARALRRAGAPAGPVGRAADGAPVWPAGWLGSITHDRGRALAVLCRATPTRLAQGRTIPRLGIDLEDLTRTETARAAAQLCLSPEERDLFATEAAVIGAFSMKEAVFKAMAPGSAARFWLSEIRLGPCLPPSPRQDAAVWAWQMPALGAAGQVWHWQNGQHCLSLCHA